MTADGRTERQEEPAEEPALDGGGGGSNDPLTLSDVEASRAEFEGRKPE